MEDQLKPRIERRTATSIYRQLQDEHDFSGSSRIVRMYVARRKQEMIDVRQEKFIKLERPQGHAQVDFGTTHVIWGEELRQIKYLSMSFPYSNAGFGVPVPSEVKTEKRNDTFGLLS